MKKTAKRTLLAVFIASVIAISIYVTTVIQSFQPQAQPIRQAPVYVEPEAPTIEELTNAVNAERAKKGVQPLRIDPLLNKSAQIKADDMVAENRMEHVDLEGKHGHQYISESGKFCINASENFFWSIPVPSEADAISWWVKSPSHYNAMVDPKYESMGFGIANKRIIVNHFCDEQ